MWRHERGQVPASGKQGLLFMAFGALCALVVSCKGCGEDGDGIFSTRCDPFDPKLARNFDPMITDECTAENIDENCDGITDKDCQCDNGETRECGDETNIGVGACNWGTQTCEYNGVWGPCIGVGHPSAEVCDRALRDEDCDGLINEEDDDLVFLRFSAERCWTSSVSAVFKDEYEHSRCVTGKPVCADGVEVCEGQVFPLVREECNFIDDDCNGLVNDNPKEERDPATGERSACGTDVGICSPGVQLCIGGDVLCRDNPDTPEQPYVPPRTEVCNAGLDDVGLDDDCDGEVNENLIRPCGINQYCSGLETCDRNGNWVNCTAQVQLPDEICDNGIDDDCNGQVDEQCLCQPFELRDCDDVTMGSPSRRNCLAGDLACPVVPCGRGEQECMSDGTWTPCVFRDEIPEQCNGGHDDDCDAATTELDAPPRVCGTDTGECQTGLQHCLVDGAWDAVCTGAVVSRPEVCDNRDNDCDGVIDNGIVRRNSVALLFLVDCSGSMWPYSMNFSISSSRFMGNFAGSDHVCAVAGVPLGASPPGFTLLTSGFVAPEDCQAVLANLGSNCGGDEWNLDALFDATGPMSSVPWPPDKFPYIIWVGDESNQTVQGSASAVVAQMEQQVAAQTTTCLLPGCQPPGCDPNLGCTPGPPEVFVMENWIYQGSYAAILNNTVNVRSRFCDILVNDPIEYGMCMESWFQDACF